MKRTRCLFYKKIKRKKRYYKKSAQPPLFGREGWRVN